MDWKLELIAVPVTDIDRAKEFYVSIGFSADHDQVVDENTRFVQLTPPGSACSIVLDLNFTAMEAGSVKGLQCVITDADEALAFLTSVGVDARGVTDEGWGRFVYFTDPDGNGWALQQLPDWSAGAQQAS
jgi:catechol 2,3-dioxygenase-like lactoylglutathione lyase family enzyme